MRTMMAGWLPGRLEAVHSQEQEGTLWVNPNEVRHYLLRIQLSELSWLSWYNYRVPDWFSHCSVLDVCICCVVSIFLNVNLELHVRCKHFFAGSIPTC